MMSWPGYTVSDEIMQNKNYIQCMFWVYCRLDKPHQEVDALFTSTTLSEVEALYFVNTEVHDLFKSRVKFFPIL